MAVDFVCQLCQKLSRSKAADAFNVRAEYMLVRSSITSFFCVDFSQTLEEVLGFASYQSTGAWDRQTVVYH